MEHFAEWNRFFEEYDRLKKSLSSDIIQHFTLDFNRINNGLSTLLEKRNRRRKDITPEFNIYRVLKIETKEVLNHSNMLACLLDPEGSHEQGYLFLKAFFEAAERAQPIPLNPPDSIEGEHWIVEREKHIPSNRFLDIVLSCTRIGYIVAIENKIRAHDQPDQMRDYQNWISQMSRYYPGGKAIYLTPYGRDSCTASSEYDYVRLSYSDHIISMIQSCIGQIKSRRLRSILDQYLEIINFL